MTEKTFEELALTYPTGQTDELPDMIRVGNFKRHDAKIPAMLPLENALGFGEPTFSIQANKYPYPHNDALRQMQYIALSLMKQVAPEMLNFTFVDIGLNTNFPILHALSEQHHIKFVAKSGDLKRELEALFEKVRYISTKCLGGVYQNLKEYNRQADYKEAYNILFIANFPKEFSEEDLKIVLELMSAGATCGILTVMNFDASFFTDKYIRDRFLKLYDISKPAMTCLNCTGSSKATAGNIGDKIIQAFFEKYDFEFENYSRDEIKELVATLNQPREEQSKQPDNFLSIPIGRSGAKKIYLEMGQKAGVHHGFIAGQSGSGKTTLLNNIIASIAELYSPDEMRLYLLDYKQGIEFQIFRNHPNVELLLLDNTNFEVGVKSLERFNNEINERSRLFMKYKCRSIDEYNKKAPDDETIPRLLMIIDEVQQLFINGWDMNKRVNNLVKQIAKQGRSYGIHMLFSSQSYIDCKIDDDTLSQMALRIAYSLANHRECRAILGPDNYAPAKFVISEYNAVYNAKNGDKDANVIVKMDDFDMETIESLLEQAAEKHAGYKPFEMKVIERQDEILPEQADTDNLTIKTVTRDEYKDNNYADVFGF